MNTKEKLINMLVSCGMFESQAIKVMAIAIPEIEKINKEATGKLNEESGEYEGAYKITWDSPSASYPTEMYNVWYATAIKPIALKWIEDNCPMAWFKPMFM
jgi:hypothetical protein